MSRRDTVTYKREAQIAALESELSEAISTLSQLATETEKEPCTHAAYCRDEMIWRKELSEAHAETAAMLEKAAALSKRRDELLMFNFNAVKDELPLDQQIRALIPTSYAAALDERVRQSVREFGGNVEAAITEASIFCLGCAKKENVVIPSRSGIVGLGAVHSSGMICVPNTVRALLAERLAALRAARQAPESTQIKGEIK